MEFPEKRIEALKEELDLEEKKKIGKKRKI